MPGDADLEDFRDRFAAHDWAATRLGATASWPLLLRRSAELLLDTPQASFLTWGDDRAMLFNRAFARWLGRGPEWLGRPFAEIWEGAAAIVLPHLSSALAGRGVLAEDMAIPAAAPGADAIRYATCSFAPLRGIDAEVVGVIGLCTETTEKMRAMARLGQERERVEALQNELIHLSRMSAMGTMASTLGHELNQPLTAIVNYASVARHSIPEGAGTQLVDALDAIYEGAMRAGRLIRSVRAMSRRAANNPAPFAVGEAVSEAIKLGSLACDCPIRTSVDGELQAYGDRVQIEQVLINLVRNACEAIVGTPGGSVEVEARPIGGKTRISVSDRGCGIPFEPIEQVFAPFMSTKSEGVGIGLPISRTIAEAHGGRLWAENREGGGAAFHLELPCHAPQ